MAENKLKPCPFCGGEGTIIVRKGKNGWRDRYAVLCDYEHGGCGAESGWYHYEVEAAEAWNMRNNEIKTSAWDEDAKIKIKSTSWSVKAEESVDNE